MLQPRQTLDHWDLDAPTFPAASGLINRTWWVGEPPRAVLQWVNPIISPLIHHDIAAVTERLAAAGLDTPRLVPCREGRLWLDDEEGCWRLLTYLPGHTVHHIDDAERAATAGRLVGRFHAALADWHHELRAPGRRIHDTPARMAELRQTLEAAEGHRLATPTREVGEAILEQWQSWEGELELPDRICHGDLKISNLRFADSGEATALIDLDTLSSMDLGAEMGDAWRSWCNPTSEDDPAGSRLDVSVFAASARAWLAAAPELTASERHSLVPGIERISLELAARFCADAVHRTYFREDRQRFPEPGRHNLVRARSQLILAHSCRDQRRACERIVDRY